MAKLDCGVNWFSGGVDRDEIIVDPRLTPIAFMLAQGAAFAQTWKEMMEYYDLPCPESEDENCPNKFGEYGLSVMLSTNAVRNAARQVVRVEAHCRVDWFLKVYCSKKVVAVPGPIPGDFEKLKEEFLQKR
jgi:hypothetical protein